LGNSRFVHFSTLALLLAQIAAILVLSRALGYVMRGLGQPLVMAEMVAGILLGPSLFGQLAPQAFVALFPPASLSVLKTISQLGLVLFMFVIGLELDPKLLRDRRGASVLISNVGILVPFALGLGAAFALHSHYATAGVAFLPFALFMGTAMSVTAFPVLARILQSNGLMQSRVGTIALACAAVDDATAWCLLAFVVAIARARGMGEVALTISLTIAFVLAMFFVARPLLRRLGDRVAARGDIVSAEVALLLLALLASAGVTELIGIHALFGAFLFGAMLPKEGDLAKLMIEKLEVVAVYLLLPLFFAYSGLNTRIGLVNSSGDWLVVLGMVALATVGKFGGSALAARATGLNWREASAIGVLMNTRGLMELIVLNVGMELGVISPTMFTMLVIMALVTTFATTPILRWINPERQVVRTGEALLTRT
jgi:Kef-type K+ transport system membrane component KefB